MRGQSLDSGYKSYLSTPSFALCSWAHECFKFSWLFILKSLLARYSNCLLVTGIHQRASRRYLAFGFDYQLAAIQVTVLLRAH